MNQEIAEFNPIVQEVIQLIDKSRHNVAIAINSEITLLYWSVGRRINDEVLGNERAEYGKQIVYALSRELNEEYGRGWSEKHLRHCMQLATVFPNEQIVYALRRQLSWTHIRSLIYIDLLFYHRRLKCLVAIDLKIGEFEASFKGQMELYLRYLEKYEQAEGETSPIGLILCTGKSKEHIELLQLDKSNIRVADYLTILPTQKILEEKLHKAVEIAHQKLSQREDINKIYYK